MNRTAFVTALILACGCAVAQDAVAPVKIETAPTSQPAQPKAKPAEKAKIYDEAADAKQQIAKALARAKKENRRVLVQWGANWCGWCHLLHEKFASDRDLSKELLYEYELVLIDIGKWDKNMDLAEGYGADLKKGVPYLTVMDANGKVLANEETGQFETKPAEGQSAQDLKPGHDAAKVLAFLKKYEATPLQADAVLQGAMDQAKASGKKVFLHFGAPWCVWCRRLDAWLERPDVAPVFAKDYVEVKIDQDRMPGGKEIESKFGMPESSGIPWFVIIDPATGKGLADATGPKGNIGFPAQPDEIEHFLSMLQKTRKNLSESDIAALKSSLQKPDDGNGAAH